METSYALFLEGPIAKGDLLNELQILDTGCTSMSITPNPNLVEKVARKLGIADVDCQEFLTKIAVIPNQPTRQDIESRNIHLLAQIAPNVPFSEIGAAYERLVNRILDAMVAERIGDQLPSLITESGVVNIAPEIEKKALARDTLQKVLGSIAFGPNLLLRRLITPDMSRPSDLEMKLLAAGADNKIVNDAKVLRANASAREVEILAQSFDDAQLEDVRTRLLVVANSIIEKYKHDPQPAVNGYHELLMTLMEKAACCDPNRLFRQDAHFLFGVICVLADECKFDWGVALA